MVISREDVEPLSLHIKTFPEVCVGFNTNCLGNLSNSISSNLSHTPSVGIIYSCPIMSATYFFASYLSTILVYSGFLSYNFNHCNFSLNVFGSFKFNFWFISNLYFMVIYFSSGIHLKKFLFIKYNNTFDGFFIYLIILFI